MSADFSTLKVKKRKKKRFVITDFKKWLKLGLSAVCSVSFCVIEVCCRAAAPL